MTIGPVKSNEKLLISLASVPYLVSQVIYERNIYLITGGRYTVRDTMHTLRI